MFGNLTLPLPFSAIPRVALQVFGGFLSGRYQDTVESSNSAVVATMIFPRQCRLRFLHPVRLVNILFPIIFL